MTNSSDKWPHLPKCGDALKSLVACNSLHGIGLPLYDAWWGGLTDPRLLEALAKRTRGPAIDVGLTFTVPSGPLKLIDLPVLLDPYEYEWHVRNFYWGEWMNDECPLPLHRLPDEETLRAHLPRLNLPGHEWDVVHASHFFQLAEEIVHKDLRLGRLSDPHSLDTGWPPPVYPADRPAPGPITRMTVRSLAVGLPATQALIDQKFAEVLGANWWCAEARRVNAIARGLFGLNIDLRKGGELVPAHQIRSAFRLAYTEDYWDHMPAELDEFIYNGFPRIPAERVARWGASELAEAVWSRDLDAALNGPGTLAMRLKTRGSKQPPGGKRSRRGANRTRR